MKAAAMNAVAGSVDGILRSADRAVDLPVEERLSPVTGVHGEMEPPEGALAFCA
jgi:hypothetical protein